MLSRGSSYEYKMDSPVASPGPSSKISSRAPSSKRLAELNLEFSSSSRMSFKQMVSARKASSKRNAFSLTSLFEEGDHTETDIDQLHFKLDEKIRRIDNERKITSSNQKKKKTGLLQRIFTMSYFREPSVLSMASIFAKAKTGDLILMKKFNSYSFGCLDLTVANGINSCTTKGFISTEQNMQLWNQVGIVVELFDYDGSAASSPHNPGLSNRPGSPSGSGKHSEMKYVLYADTMGIKLTELTQLMTANLATDSPVALRQLSISDSAERKTKIIESIQQLGWVILRQYDGTWHYDSAQGVHPQSRKVDTPIPHAEASPVEEKVASSDAQTGPEIESSAIVVETSGRSGLSDDEVLQRLINVVVYRTKLTLFTPSAEDIADSRRAFFALDSNGDGTLEMKEVVMLLSGTAASSGADKATHEEFVRKYLAAMDRNGDGVISVEEYVQAYKTLPVQEPNANLDVRAIVNAEFVVCLYTAVGLVRPEYVTDDISYLPHSFASTSTHASASMNELLPRHVKARAATVEPLNLSGGGESTEGQSRDYTRYINNRLRYFMMVKSKLQHEVLVKLYD